MKLDSSDNSEAEITTDPNKDLVVEKTSFTSTLMPSTLATSMNVRIGLAVYGVLLPIVCHLMTINSSPHRPSWQSGRISDKLSYVLSGECGWPIFPFLIFAMFSLSMAIRNEISAFSKSWVRHGIFSGVIVCGWYLLVFSWTALGSPWSVIGQLIGAAIGIFVVHGVIWFLSTRKFAVNLVPIAVTLGGGGVLLIVLVAVVEPGVLGIFLVPFFYLLLFSTPLAFLTYLWMSIRVLKLHPPARRFPLAQLMFWVTWLAAFGSALRTTIGLSLAKYAQLPLEPPENCYIATAATKGYPWVVGAKTLPTTTTQPMIVNSQLAIFKAAELTLRAISPKGHRAFRFVYDRLGRRAASMLRGPLIATAAYLCLKPAEWLCRIVLRILLGRQMSQQAQQLYLSRAKQ